jgi:hypothetical protein
VHVPRLAADERFVGFDFARQQSESTLSQSEAQTMRHEPSGLLGHAKIAGQFAGAYAILAIHDQPKRGKPLVQAERRFLENRASLEREGWLLVSGVALPYAGLGKVGYFLRSASWAGHFAIGPAKLYHELVAVLVVAEVDDCLLKCLYAVHAVNIRLLPWYVKYIITLNRLVAFRLRPNTEVSCIDRSVCRRSNGHVCSQDNSRVRYVEWHKRA